MLEQPSSEDSSKNYELEALLDWGNDPESEGYIANIGVAGSSKNKVKVTCKVPKNKSVKFKNYSAKTADGFNNVLFGNVQIEKIELNNNQDCNHTIDGNIITFTNTTSDEKNQHIQSLTQKKPMKVKNILH